MPDRQDLSLHGHMSSCPRDHCSDQFIAIILVRLAYAYSQVGFAKRVVGVRLGEELPLYNWVGNPKPVAYSIKVELRSDPALRIAERLTRCEDSYWNCPDMNELE